MFFHNAGYSTACGHGTIALVTWALDEGIVERREGENRVVVDVPSGRLETVATVVDGRVRSVTFRNVPSFVWATDVRVGDVAVDIAFGGAFYATLRERVEPAELPRLIELGREIKRGLEAQHEIVHPLEPELRDVYGVIFWQHGGRGAADPAQRDGVRRRRGRPLALRLRAPRRGSRCSTRPAICPAAPSCATSRSSARAFTGRVVDEVSVAGHQAVVTEVTGSAYRTGESTFTLDPDDPLGEGFLLR